MLMQGVHPLPPGRHLRGAEPLRSSRHQRRDAQGDGDPTTGSGVHIGHRRVGTWPTSRSCTPRANRIGWGGEWPSRCTTWPMGESGFNNVAQNPSSSAYGMFQFLDSTWGGVGGHKTSDPWLQTKYGLELHQEQLR